MSTPFEEIVWNVAHAYVRHGPFGSNCWDPALAEYLKTKCIPFGAMSLNSLNQHVVVVTSPCWNWTATNVFLQPAGAVYAYNSSIRVNGSTYFGTNSARGKITRVWIQAEYVDTHITQRLDRYQVMYNKYTFRCKILRNFGRYVQILYGTSASTCSFV